MGLYKSTPHLAGRIGTLWTLSTIKESAVIEFGCMGHTVYARTFLSRMGAQGGKLYSTHIRETDIAMGDTTRLTNAVKEVLEDKNISTIFLLPSTVPEIIGIDLKAIAEELSFENPDITFITFDTGSFNMSLEKGVEKTLLTLAKNLTQNKEKSEDVTYNIIGSCADMYNFNSDCLEIERILEKAFNIKKNCVMTSNTSITSLRNIAKAHINIVLREEGVSTAKYLEKKYGVPFVYCRPYGFERTLEWLGNISEIINIEVNSDFIKIEKESYLELIEPYKLIMHRFMFAHKDQSNLIAIGHKDVVNGICDYCIDEFNFKDVKRYTDCLEHETENTKYLTEEEKLNIKNLNKCFMMGSHEIIKIFDNVGIQISNPDFSWRHPYLAPLIGFRGSINIGSLLANELFKID